jgi:hypothetical protein
MPSCSSQAPYGQPALGRLNARSLLYLTCSDLRGHFFDIGHLR